MNNNTHESPEQKMARTSVHMRMEVRSLPDAMVQEGANTAAALVKRGRVSQETAVNVGVRVARWRWYKTVSALIIVVTLALLWFNMASTASADGNHLVYLPIANNPVKMSWWVAPTPTPTPELSAPIVTPEPAK